MKFEAEIEMVPVEEIHPFEKNPRENGATVDALAKSIRKYGFNQPIVIDKRGVIVKGHTRYAAAIQLGMEEVPAIRSKMSAKKARADRILDNRVHDLSKWDGEALSFEMRDVEDGITRILSDFGVESYSEQHVPDVEAKDVEKAESEVEELGNRSPDLIRVACAQGTEMWLSREAVKNLK